jgi:hypothetical protein
MVEVSLARIVLQVDFSDLNNGNRIVECRKDSREDIKKKKGRKFASHSRQGSETHVVGRMDMMMSKWKFQRKTINLYLSFSIM